MHAELVTLKFHFITQLSEISKSCTINCHVAMPLIHDTSDAWNILVGKGPSLIVIVQTKKLNYDTNKTTHTEQ